MAAIVMALAVIYPLSFWGMYSGDAEIHLVYAKNAASGHFFEFNPGEKSAGVTSPGYMLLLATFFRVFRAQSVPLAVKIVNILTWYGVVLVVYILSRCMLANNRLALAAAGVTAVLPGAVYNATTGMENGLFALVVLSWAWLVLRVKWFTEARVEVGLELLLGVLLGAATWLRPEAVVVGAVAAGCRFWYARGRRRELSVSVALFCLAFAVPLSVLLGFHVVQTGQWLPASGRARVIMGQLDSYRFGPLAVNTKFLIRILVYLPLTLAWLAGAWRVLKGQDEAGTHGVAGFFVAVFISFFVLYSTVLGADSLARYTIFVMPMMVLVAIDGTRWVWQNWETLAARRIVGRGFAFAVAVAMLLIVFAGETIARRRAQIGQAELRRAMNAPSEVESASDRLFNELGRPSKRPITIATQEVQIRYWLDDRFVVRSLDGRVDSMLLDFIHDGNVDHVGYLKARRVDFLLETRNYNRDPSKWSLDALTALRTGETTVVDGLSFTRLSRPITFRLK
ncbi:MAG: hypothetical protein LAO77_14400 [Acidobacteriia bacterium]|nr:hypothetical protein [Terriglobia bacterium]